MLGILSDDVPQLLASGDDMGLDCVPLGLPEPGHEEEWNRLMELIYAGLNTEERWDRLDKISVPPFDTIDPPRVGRDKEADDRMLAHKSSKYEKSDAEYLAALRDFPVTALLAGKCDGVSGYSIGMLFPSEDATWFRGENFKGIEWIEFDMDRAWTEFMRPAEAVEYGESLLAAAARGRCGEIVSPAPSPTFEPIRRRRFDFLLGGRRSSVSSRLLPTPAESPPTPEQKAAQIAAEIKLLEASGRWYVFWGSRGHPIWAYY